MTAMARPALLYFLLWLGVTLSSAMNLEKRIIGGHDCDNAEQRQYVMLIVGGHVCGGSLIRDQWVLTAAHCSVPGLPILAYVNAHPGYEEEKMSIAPNSTYQILGHDIMLLRLPRRPRDIYSLALPTAEQCKNLQVNKWFRVAGFGNSGLAQENKFMKLNPPRLQCIDMPVVSCWPVRVTLRMGNLFTPFGNYFCAQTGGRDTAHGDSGGGAVFNNMIYGVVSSGHPTHAFVEPCVFLRVCSYLEWINKTIDNYSEHA